LFSDLQERILDLYYIPVYVQSNLFTDDSFKFNEVVRELNEMLESLQIYTKTQDTYLHLSTSLDSVYEAFGVSDSQAKPAEA
jgi:hypothetical protein